MYIEEHTRLAADTSQWTAPHRNGHRRRDTNKDFSHTASEDLLIIMFQYLLRRWAMYLLYIIRVYAQYDIYIYIYIYRNSRADQ